MFVFGGGKKRIPKIANSLRLRAAAGAYLSKTFAASGNNQKWTYSVWVKRGTLGTSQELLSSGTSTSNFDAFYFNASNNLCFLEVVSGVTRTSLITTQVFRDPSAWYHIVLSYDSTQAVAADRISVSVNRVKVTSFSTATYPALNNGSYINWTSIQTIGKYAASAIEYVDGYLARICFVDGQALTPSSFGYIENSISQWVSKSQSACKSVVDAGGANSFMLDFDNGTSLTTLGYDKSSKANNWTLTGASLTNGPAYDWMIDTPTNNFPTCAATGFGAPNAPQDANLSVGGTDSFSTCSMPIPKTGIWRAEVFLNSVGSQDVTVGIAQAGTTGNSTNIEGFGGYGWGLKLGRRWFNGASTTGYSVAAAGNNITLIYNADTGQLDIYNSTSLVMSITGIPTSVEYSFGQSRGGTTGTNSVGWNFGQRPWVSAISTTAKAICSANLPLPVIKSPKKHFDVALHAGTTGTTHSITGVQFTPDLIWIKARDKNYNYAIVDSVRGTSNTLVTNSTSAESTLNTVVSFDSTGFTLGNDQTVDDTTTVNYVDWIWKAGGAAVTNTDGTITSQVSANTAAGFSIITYTSDTSGTPKTVGHGLGVAPSMIIVKSRSTGQNWPVYHNSLTSASYYVMLNSTAAQASLAAIWNSTAPSSTVFSIGGSPMVNSDLGANYVAYCFAEVPGFSKIGSYTGNGSADGPFVYCGFRPRYVMTKRTDATSDWVIHDTARDANNPAVLELYADLSNAEANASRACDFLSNGFKLRDTNAMWNASGGTYIFIAFAESPFKYANAR